MKKYIVWLNAAKKTGKDFFFNLVKENFSDYYNIERISFADQLKLEYISENKEKVANLAIQTWLVNEPIKNILNYSDEQFLKIIDELKNNPDTPVRTDLQRIWSERKVTHWPDYWVNKAFIQLEDRFQELQGSWRDTIFFITDLRFIDEAVSIIKNNWIIVSFKNYRQLQENVDRLYNNNETSIKHISEKLSYLPVDAWIVYSLVPNYLVNWFDNLFADKNSLLNIAYDIIMLVQNKKEITEDEISRLEKIKEEWIELFNDEIMQDQFNISESAELKMSYLVAELNQILRKQLWILY